jgi:hypothetical protein
MINEARPFASLSSGLLARKGAAKPAMRPQGFGPGGYEDLGWNDMGYEPREEADEAEREHVPSSIAALTPAPRPVQLEEAVEPHVVAQQRAIAESYAAPSEPQAESPPEPAAPEPAAPEPAAAPREPAAIVSLPRQAAPVALGRKAAFTLRLDADRHLRLRLATAVTGRSAQHIVTAALDQFLASIPEVESLAERIPAAAGKRS